MIIAIITLIIRVIIMIIIVIASRANSDAFSLGQKSLQHVTAVGHVHASLCETSQMPLTFQNPHAVIYNNIQ